MYLVLDCNQAARLPTDRSVTRKYSLILPTSVLAEIFLRTDPHPTLDRIRHYHFQIGLDTSDVMLEISRIGPQEIRCFEPFYKRRCLYQHDYEYLFMGIYKPSSNHAAWAANVKHAHLQSCGTLVGQALPARKEIKKAVQDHQAQAKKNNVPPERKPLTYGDILPYERPDLSGFIFFTLVRALSWYGFGPDRAGFIYDAVVSNQYLGRLFRSLHAYALGRSGAWRDQNDNFSPPASQDDITDIVLPLYAGDGDAILSEDKLLRRIVRLIEVGSSAVTITKASAL